MVVVGCTLVFTYTLALSLAHSSLFAYSYVHTLFLLRTSFSLALSLCTGNHVVHQKRIKNVGILPDETFKNGGRGSRRAICDRCQWGQSGKDRSGDEVRHSFVVCNGLFGDLFGDCLMIV